MRAEVIPVPTLEATRLAYLEMHLAYVISKSAVGSQPQTVFKAANPAKAKIPQTRP